MITHWVEALWYRHKLLALPLLPLSWLFNVIAVRRKKKLLDLQPSNDDSLAPPVIVVGNITVGGTGKTPLVIAIIQFLQQQGFKPGVISRGFGGKAKYPYQLNSHSTTQESGDEPLLIFTRCACPVVVSPKRCDAVRHLLADNDVDIIISDDGLQHYALARDIEICVVDGQRQLGNGYCLPAGPLREPASRLNSVDFIVMNGPQNTLAPKVVDVEFTSMNLATQPLKALPASQNVAVPASTEVVHGVAAIGNPQRFFDTLTQQGFTVETHRFIDHHHYQEHELLFNDQHPVIMTEKDAVKCLTFSGLKRHFYLPVEAVLADEFWQALLAKIEKVKKNKDES
ncbi:MAG: tetraacyldisaccharide 4'-kinase [Pseudomonadales bacterium]|nr:tetraacyldisaccharide 4'-kinase [Pseudomonadales bacterium]